MMSAARAGSHAGAAETMVEARFVTSVEFWMRAYPRRWREARGQELLDVVVDLAGPGAQRLDARSAFDLVRGGWATRWREHPVPHTWLLYRMFDRRLPVAYRSWALDDIDGLWYPMRRILGGAWWLPLWFLFLSHTDGFSAISALIVFALMVPSSMFIAPGYTRSQARLRQVAPKFGEVPVEGALVAWDVPRQRVQAKSGLAWAMPLLGTTGAASLVAALVAPKVLLSNFTLNGPGMGPGFTLDSVVAPMGGYRIVGVAILLVALCFGALGAIVVRRRLGRLLGERPDQPYRVLHPVAALGAARVLFSAIVMAGVIWLELSGRLVLGLSVAAGTVALLLLPGALVALLVTGGADAHDLAGRDVWWIATRGRVPGLDQPARGWRPRPGPVPQGALAQPTGPTGPAWRHAIPAQPIAPSERSAALGTRRAGTRTFRPGRAASRH